MVTGVAPPAWRSPMLSASTFLEEQLELPLGAHASATRRGKPRARLQKLHPLLRSILCTPSRAVVVVTLT